MTPLYLRPTAATRARMVLLAALLFPLTSAAQPTESDANEQAVVRLDAFDVTATPDRGYAASNAISAFRINTPIQELPLNISVVTDQFIQDIGATSLDEALVFTPAATDRGVDTDFFGIDGSLAIRGISASRPKRNGFNRPLFTDTTNVQRIEIVKGPVSALFGSAEPGGIVNYVTKKPSTRAGLKVQQSVGSWDYFRTTLEANAPLVGDTLLFRVDASYLDREGYRDFDREDRTFIAPALQWSPGRDTRVLVDYEYLKRDFNPVARNIVWNPEAFARWEARTDAGKFSNATLFSVPTTPGGVRAWTDIAFHIPLTVNSAGPGSYREHEIGIGTIEVQHVFNDVFSLRATTAFSEQDTETLFATSNRTRVTGDGVSRSTKLSRSTGDNWFSQIDALATFRTGGVDHRLVAGAEFIRDRGESQTFQTTVSGRLYFLDETPLPTAGNPVVRDYTLGDPTRNIGSNSTLNEVTSFYGSYQLSAFENRTRLLAGLRYDESSAFNRLTNQDARPDVSQTSAQIGINHSLTPWLAAYANYAESFLPQFGTMRQLNPDGLGVTIVPRPVQRGEGWEVGLKAKTEDGRLSGTATLFHVARTDVVQGFNVFPDGPSDPSSQFGADRLVEGEESDGFEIDLIYSPIDNLQLKLGYAHIDSQVIDPADNFDNFNPDFDARIPGVPRNQVSLFGKYDFVQGRGRGLSFGGGVVWMDKRRGGGLREDFLVLDAYARVDVFASYRGRLGDNAWTVAVNVENLFDELYFTPGPYVGDPFNARVTFGLEF